MSVSIMTLVWERSRHKGNTLHLLLAIADHANDEGIAWPSKGKASEGRGLAAKLRVSESRIDQMMRELLDSGELKIISQGGGKPNALTHARTNIVQIDREVLEANPVQWVSGRGKNTKGLAGYPLRGESATPIGDSGLPPNHNRTINNHQLPGDPGRSLSVASNTPDGFDPYGEGEGITPAPPAPAPPQGKKKAERDARLDHPAVKAYRDETRRHAPVVARSEIIAAVGDDCQKWRDHVHAWIMRGYNPLNIGGMLETFKSGASLSPGGQRQGESQLAPKFQAGDEQTWYQKMK